MGQQANSNAFILFIHQIEQNIVEYCLNEYCCRIIQRMFENCHLALIQKASDTIVRHFKDMCHNEFGIFVLSSMLDNGQNEHKSGILKQIIGQGAQLAINKDGSKLVENSIKMMWSIHQGGKHHEQIDLL